MKDKTIDKLSHGLAWIVAIGSSEAAFVFLFVAALLTYCTGEIYDAENCRTNEYRIEQLQKEVDTLKANK